MRGHDLRRGLRIIFEVIRTGRPPRRARPSFAWWRWLVAVLLALAVAALRLISE